jgi:transmembrane sensor
MSGFDDWLGQKIPDHIMEDAATWMALLDSSNCTSADRIGFARWLSTDPLHQGAFEELSEVWAKLHMLSDVSAMVDHPDVIPFPVQAENREFQDEVKPRRSEWSTLTTSLLIVVGVIIHTIFGPPSDLHETQTGEIQTIALEDGSTVELNARSTIEVQIDGKRREIRLSNGEAVFHVEEDERPFIVRTELATVSAVGTRFSVRTDTSLVEVSVIDGLVSVAATRSGIALTEYESDLLVRFTDEIALLGAGQRLELTRENERYEVVSERVLADDLSWRNGEVVFSDTPLVAALAEMRRYLEVSVIVGDPVLNSLRISGRVPTGDAEYFLTLLKEEYEISVERDAQKFAVLRPK